MQRYLIFSFFAGLFVYLTSCEVDDICTETVLTPRLVVKFYNDTARTRIKAVENLSVYAVGKDSLYKKTTLDSILLPLNTFENATKFVLTKGLIRDTLTVNYTKNNVFVSRSCGYKTDFSIPATPSLTQQWTKGITLISTPQLIENEYKAHVKIYH